MKGCGQRTRCSWLNQGGTTELFSSLRPWAEGWRLFVLSAAEKESRAIRVIPVLPERHNQNVRARWAQ